MSILSWLDTGEAILGVVLTLVAAIAGFLGWLDRRSRKMADEVRTASDAQHERTQVRLSKVEAQLGSMEGAVADMDGRVKVLEARLETLATSKDLGDVEVKVAGVYATVERLAGQMDTLYRAALERSEKQGAGS